VTIINLYNFTEEFVWCFANSHTTTFELISSVASVLPGTLVTSGAEYGSFPVTVGVTIADSRRRQCVYRVSTSGGETALSRETRREADSDVAEQRTLTVQHTGHYDGTKETAEYLISAVRRANTRRSAVGDDGDQCDGGRSGDATREIIHEDVDITTEFGSLRRSLQSSSGCRCPT